MIIYEATAECKAGMEDMAVNERALLPVLGIRLVINSLPVLFASLTIVQVVAQDIILLLWLLPLKQH